jgi:hypothetical protein
MGLLSAIGQMFNAPGEAPNALMRFGAALNGETGNMYDTIAKENLLSSMDNIEPPPATDPAALSLYAAAKADPEKFLPLYAQHVQTMQTNPLTMMSYGTGTNSPAAPLPWQQPPASAGSNPLAQVNDVLQPSGTSATAQPSDGKNYSYLNSAVPPIYRNIVKGMVEGQDVPVSMRGDPKLGSALKIWASNFDPSFSDSTYEARNKTLKDFSSGGKEASSIIAGQTALEHLANFVKNVKAQRNTPIQPLNYIGNEVSAMLGDPKVLRAQADKATLASELAAFYKSGSPTDSGTKEMMDILSTNQGNAGTDAMGHEVGTLMKGKIKSLRDQFDSAMGAGAANKRNIFSADALKVLEDLGVDTSDIIQPNHPAKAKPAPNTVSVANPQTAQQPSITPEQVRAELKRRGKF